MGVGKGLTLRCTSNCELGLNSLLSRTIFQVYICSSKSENTSHFSSHFSASSAFEHVPIQRTTVLKNSCLKTKAR